MDALPGLSLDRVQQEVKAFLHFLDQEQHKCFGIQINQDVRDCQMFAPLLSHTLNNLGDPFSGQGGHLVTFDYERELVSLVSSLLHLSSDNSWGYYNPGSTLSNMHGVHLGMRRFEEPTIIISEESHNSFEKAAVVTRCKELVKIKTDLQGRMLPDHLEEQLKALNRKNYIFAFCSGSVTKGAYDNSEELLQVISGCGIEPDDYHLHIDAALGGMVTPFLMGEPIKLDFRILEADSLSVSFHKRLGIPLPGSLFIARKSSLQNLPPSLYAEHYSSYDTTLGGSRDGLSPFITLMKLKHLGHSEMRKRTQRVIDKAAWLVDLLRQNGVSAWCNSHSPCAVLPAPSPQLAREYHLPRYSAAEGDYTHIFTMEHVSRSGLETFVEKYLLDTARAWQPAPVFSPVSAGCR